MNTSQPDLWHRMLAVPGLTVVVICAVAAVTAVAVLTTGLSDLWLAMDLLPKLISAVIAVIIAVPLLDWLVLIIIGRISSRQTKLRDRQETSRKV